VAEFWNLTASPATIAAGILAGQPPMPRFGTLQAVAAKECGMGLGEQVKNHAIEMAGRADAREAADVFTRAFHDDPAFSWILPAEDTRSRRLRRYFVIELRRESLRHGGVEVARDGGRIAGAAVWFPPGTWTGTQLGALPGDLRAFGRRLDVCSRYMSVAVRAHPREQPHWYLAIIGVDPSRKGRGVGAALLRSRLEPHQHAAAPVQVHSDDLRAVVGFGHKGLPTWWRRMHATSSIRQKRRPASSSHQTVTVVGSASCVTWANAVTLITEPALIPRISLIRLHEYLIRRTERTVEARPVVVVCSVVVPALSFCVGVSCILGSSTTYC